MPIGNQIQYTDNVANKILSFTATASQTTFTITGGYRINAISVYKNGLRLANGVDFTATDGATVILTSGATVDDKVVVQIWDDINIGYIDSTPGSFSVGNELSVAGITTVGDIYATGIITATSFAGDGSELTGVAGGKWASNDTGINTSTSIAIGTTTASSALTVTGDATLTGVVTATTFLGALTGNVTGNASGSSGSCTGYAATATALASARDIGGVSFDGTGNINLPGVNQAGDQNTTGTAGGLTGTPSITVQDVTAEYVSIAGTLTYDDVVSVDSVGLITAQTGVRVTAGGIVVTAGVVTVTDVIDAAQEIQVGTAIQLGQAGVITATSFSGSGANLTGVSAGLSLQQAGSWISAGTAATTVNFASGATLTAVDSGISTITIAAPSISTTASSPGANTVITLDLDSAQHHQLTLSAGINTISCSGGSFGDSHSVVAIQPASGIATVGFTTYFLWPSGSIPNMSQGSSKVDMLSFVVKKEGAVGTGTELLASAGLDYSY